MMMLFILPDSVIAQRPDLRTKKITDENQNGIPDEEENLPAKPKVEEFRRAKVIIDGKPKVFSDLFVTPKNKTISVLVLQLQPQSLVEINLEKAGVGTTKTAYQCNELGVLFLELKSGPKKGQALLNVKYTTSDNEPHAEKIYIKIE